MMEQMEHITSYQLYKYFVFVQCFALNDGQMKMDGYQSKSHSLYIPVLV